MENLRKLSLNTINLWLPQILFKLLNLQIKNGELSQLSLHFKYFRSRSIDKIFQVSKD